MLSPTGEVAFFLGQNFIYTCHSSLIYHNITEIEWLINGTRYNGSSNSIIGETLITKNTDINNDISQLILTSLHSNFNGTTLQCRVIYNTDQMSAMSDTSLLWLQGNSGA